MTSGVGATFTFDVANRILSAAEISGGVEYYSYAPDNRRIYKKLTSGAEEYTFFGGQGEKLGVYNLTGSTMSALRTNLWFGGKLISENSNAVFPDRVGTNRASGARFHPYGDEITSTTNDREKFATYTRDGYTGLDYADQRYYTSSYGRFNTPDPDGGSAKPSKPGSWNRFAYVSGDPVNLRDRRGLEEEDCSLDYEEDGTIDQGCCLPTAFWSGGEEDFACSAVGGPSGGGGSPPTRTTCDIDFGYATVAALGKHTFLELTQNYSDGSTVVDYIEAADTDANSPSPPAGTNPKWGYLNFFDTPTGIYYPEMTYTVTQTAASIGVYGSAICDDVDQIFARAALYAQNVNWKIHYHWYGTNSNSFTHWILDGVPSLAGFTPSFGAVGWNKDGNINKYIP